MCIFVLKGDCSLNVQLNSAIAFYKEDHYKEIHLTFFIATWYLVQISHIFLINSYLKAEYIQV